MTRDQRIPEETVGDHPAQMRAGLAVFLAGIAITAVTVSILALTAADRDRQAFQAATEEAQDAVLDRVETSIALLRGTAGLFASHERAVTVQTFRHYVGRLALREQYPGLLGIGFSRRIAPGEVETLEREMRAQGQPDFHVWPKEPREEVHAIVYLEPLDERNRAAVGYDMYTDETRRVAMARARDTGRASASHIVELVQEIDENKQPGFLIYLPVYRGGAIPATIDERRARLLGFAYSPIRAGDFLSSAFTHEAAPSLNFAVYHGTSPNPSALLFTHAAPPKGTPRLKATFTVDVAGEPWTFVFQSRTTLAQALAMPIIAALAGIALSWLLALLAGREMRARGAAQRALERERAARAEAERANAMKDQFLATLSHELRTPISAIVGWASLLRQKNLPESRLPEGLQVIDRNARAQARLIDELLDMHGIISGKLHIDMRPVDVRAVLDHALAAIAPAAQGKGISIERPVASSPLTVHGDAARLQQVVWNLLSNAVKFTPRGGRIRVALERADGHLRLAVSDTGEGIDPTALDRIFDRFAQADGSITRRHGGLGLGLAIVRQLVLLHGGTVRGESRGAGLGATFTVELPLLAQSAEKAGVETDTDSAAQLTLEGLSVLVVDDERDARELLRVVLEERKARVQCVASAAEALAAVRAARPDILVSDIGMPDIDGYELMRRIDALEPESSKKMIAIALTAYARDEDRVEALRAGYRMHIAKPVQPDEIVRVIARLARPESAAA